MSTGSIDMGQVSQFLLATEVKGMLLLLSAALGAVALHRSAAAARHWVWLLGMAGLLALPAITFALPTWSAPMPQWTSFRSQPPVVHAVSAGDGSWTVDAPRESTNRRATSAAQTAGPAFSRDAVSPLSTDVQNEFLGTILSSRTARLLSWEVPRTDRLSTQAPPEVP